MFFSISFFYRKSLLASSKTSTLETIENVYMANFYTYQFYTFPILRIGKWNKPIRGWDQIVSQI